MTILPSTRRANIPQSCFPIQQVVGNHMSSDDDPCSTAFFTKVVVGPPKLKSATAAKPIVMPDILINSRLVKLIF
ncbi:MAG: hypothetical protein ACXAEX_05585 [Promethearchaeota archaeon]